MSSASSPSSTSDIRVPNAYRALEEKMIEYHDAEYYARCRPDQCPTHEISKTPTAIFSSEAHEVALLTWTTEHTGPGLHVFFAEEGFYQFLRDLSWEGDNAYAKLDVAVGDEGEKTKFEVFLAYLVDKSYGKWVENPIKCADDLQRNTVETRTLAECSLAFPRIHFRYGNEAMEGRKVEIFESRARQAARQIELDAEQAREAEEGPHNEA